MKNLRTFPQIYFPYLSLFTKLFFQLVIFPSLNLKLNIDKKNKKPFQNFLSPLYSPCKKRTTTTRLVLNKHIITLTVIGTCSYEIFIISILLVIFFWVNYVCKISCHKDCLRKCSLCSRFPFAQTKMLTGVGFLNPQMV